ncbi:glycosyltransferase family 2 protein [Bacillus pseudomycoides]|uniref:glycosyltransferase family 2 protein n=1 Tax=Bacillus pseudomycoides TaxID=64104 RepID=UPI000BED46B6|nr:glycosyltransferase family 2 protein [Bacillus pseudomycoides]MED4653812.1 glycosyltransferase family 2 protein [Bacillus pseudomycoides]PEE03737.1 glycosyl transferase family 2 [Bacillus pseudomycoides]PEM75944.1 glycosyl transferase family 2 [Bacillus pseudomycoides]PHC88507.1 glycosyl transferase family 2 [Bacillus pseudomycoides]
MSVEVPISIPKTLIIIPAYNEEEAIGDTLTRLLELKQHFTQLDICVINDGSRDRTSEIVKEFPVNIVNLPYNLGIGSAVQTGYKYADINGYDIAIQFDADGQHNPEDLYKIIQPIAENKCDMVLGSRFTEKTAYKGSLSRRIGIFYFTALLKLLTRQTFMDPTSGYRAINRKVIEIFSYNYPKDYPEPEVLIHLKKKGLRVNEISVNMQERQGGQSSITPLKSAYYMIKVSLAILMQKIVKG